MVYYMTGSQSQNVSSMSCLPAENGVLENERGAE